ncbi:MAG: hypothetical protein KF764_04535 [Labilithrix sp.]|nr:hypothetical protein [Labilithrix sp.]MBX3223182.1 hypothetical protein [Labilithrix sp.]
MPRLRLRSSFVGLGVTFLVACSALPEEEQASTSNAVAVAGRWRLPAAVATAGAKVRLPYDGAPNWSARACSGKLRAGTDRLGDFLEDEFAAITSVGGYACRQNTANRKKMSVHGTGRALDIFIPKIGGQANNTKGDAVANWLVMNAARIGVQMVIWDRTVWMANGKNDRAYSGPHPHDDHLHVELTVAASAMQTPWFSNPQGSDAGPIDLEPEEDDTLAPDASTPQLDSDPNPDLDPDEDPDPVPDEPAPPADPTPNGGQPPADTTDPANEGSSTPADFPDQGDEAPLQDDEPAEGDSDGPSRSSSKKRARDEEVASAGCSAAPSGSTTGAVAVPLALVVAAALVRRRRRD